VFGVFGFKESMGHYDQHTRGRAVNKDLDKAISIFNMIPTHPDTRNTLEILPDAVTFEALINVLVALKYIDKAKCIKQKALDNIIQEVRLSETNPSNLPMTFSSRLIILSS
jgi:hypothetical protein